MSNLSIAAMVLFQLAAVFYAGMQTSRRMTKKAGKPQSVLLDGYTILMTDDKIPHLELVLETEAGQSSYILGPSYAHKLADELSVASIRCAPKALAYETNTDIAG